LLTPKHDPQNLGIQYHKFRTIVIEDLANNFEDFLMSDEYNIFHYIDNQNRDYYEIESLDPDYYIPASGVPSYSPHPTTPCDRLVAVSGYVQGWHIFGENSQIIGCRNDLQFIEKL